MAILKIARMGDPSLSQPAEPVADPTASEINQLLKDMNETMIDADGTGLAAPQVHVRKRVLLFMAERGSSDQGEINVTEHAPLTALIASLIDVKSEVDVIVAVTVDSAELFPCNVKVYVAAALNES